MRESLSLTLPDTFEDVHLLHSECLTAQARFENKSSASVRRKFRETPQVKELRRQLQAATTEPARVAFLAELIAARRHIACTLKRIKQMNRFSVGGSISKHSKLTNITSMYPPGTDIKSASAAATVTDDPEKWTQWLTSEYESKWRANEDLRLKAAKHFLDETCVVVFYVF